MTEEQVLEKYKYIAVKFAIHYSKYAVNEKEDIEAVGLVAIINGFRTYDPTKGKLFTYIYACIRNETFKYMNKFFTQYPKEDKNHRKSHASIHNPLFQNTLSTQFEISDNTLLAWVMLDSLEYKEQELMVDYHINGFVCKELGERKGVSKQAVHYQIQNIENKLKDNFEFCYAE